MPAERAAALADGPVTTHLDTTDPRQRHAVANEFLSHDFGRSGRGEPYER